VLLLPGPGQGRKHSQCRDDGVAIPARRLIPGVAQSRGGGRRGRCSRGQDKLYVALSMALLAGVLLAMLVVVW